jgi:hypothetical protein
MKQGMSPNDAVRSVRLERGSPELAKEVVRSGNWASRVLACWQLLAQLSRTAVTETTPATCENAVWHCPTCGAAMIILQRFTAAELSLCVHFRFFVTPQPKRPLDILHYVTALMCSCHVHELPRTPLTAIFRPHLQSYRRSFLLLLLSFLCTPSPPPVPNSHSIPIVQRVRRNRRRLSSSLPIENASDPLLDPRALFCPRHFRSSLATNRELACVPRLVRE